MTSRARVVSSPPSVASSPRRPRRAARARAARAARAAAAMPSAPAKTELAYFDDTYLASCYAKVLAVEAVEARDDGGGDGGGDCALVLDRTIAYPAGGGQPSDTGRVVLGDGRATFAVRAVEISKEGVVRHLGRVEGADDDELSASEASVASVFEPGADVVVHVDVDRRVLHARVHSAGHLLDVAMSEIGLGPESGLVPAKGQHHVDGAYVEYSGKIDGLDKEKLARDLAAKMTELVERGGATSAETMPYDDAAAACGGSLPAYVAKDSTPHVVRVPAAAAGCPCGGTHVKDVREIGDVEIVGVRVKKGTTRVSYTIEGMTGHRAA